MTVKNDYRITPEKQSLEELWKSVAQLAQGRVEDNSLSEEYPLEVRKRQMVSLKALVNTLEETHEQIEREQAEQEQVSE